MADEQLEEYRRKMSQRYSKPDKKEEPIKKIEEEKKVQGSYIQTDEEIAKSNIFNMIINILNTSFI